MGGSSSELSSPLEPTEGRRCEAGAGPPAAGAALTHCFLGLGRTPGCSDSPAWNPGRRQRWARPASPDGTSDLGSQTQIPLWRLTPPEPPPPRGVARCHLTGALLRAFPLFQCFLENLLHGYLQTVHGDQGETVSSVSARGGREAERRWARARADAVLATPRDSHSDKQRLPGGQAGRGELLHQSQGAEAKFMDGLIGVQRGEVGVHLTVVLGDVETVGVHILAAGARRGADS